MCFTSEHVALAEQLLLCLKEDRNKALITYGDLCERAGDVVTPRNCGQYLGVLSEFCYDNDMPLISAMVVNQSEWMSGNGFFKLYTDLTGKPVVDKFKVFKRN